MSIILDDGDGDSPRGQEMPLRLKALKAWLAQRERERQGDANREIVSSLYPASRRGSSEQRPPDPASL